MLSLIRFYWKNKAGMAESNSVGDDEQHSGFLFLSLGQPESLYQILATTFQILFLLKMCRLTRQVFSDKKWGGTCENCANSRSGKQRQVLKYWSWDAPCKYNTGVNLFCYNKNTKCPIDAHCHRHCRRDPRITNDCIELGLGSHIWQGCNRSAFAKQFNSLINGFSQTKYI